jgi:hypothetical protein
MVSPRTHSLTAWLDRTGVLLSAVCLVHCLALPILLTLIPMTQLGWLDEQLFHDLLLTVILPTSVIALCLGCHRHRQWKILGVGFVGLGILAVLSLVPHALIAPLVERLLTIFAGCLLVFAHIANFRRCRDEDCHHD